MSLLHLLIVLIVIGVILYCVNNYLPMDPAIKRILNIAVVVIVVIWLLSLLLGFAGMGSLGTIRVG